MELMQAVEHYATAMKLAERYGNKHGDVDAANNAWNECKKAADEIAELRAWREKAFTAHPNGSARGREGGGMTDQYEKLRRALFHYRSEPDSVIAQEMVTRRATPDLVSVLLAERDALLQRLREIVESVEERDREIERRARAMKIMSERVKELTARLKQYEPVSPWGGAAPANEKEAE